MTRHPTSGLVACLAVLCATALLLVGCRSVADAPANPDKVDPVALVGSGSEHGGWRAWVYRTRDGGLCLEIRGTDGGGVGCGTGPDALTEPGVQSSRQGTFVTGGTRNASAASATIHLADGSTASGPLNKAAGVVDGLRVCVIAVPTGAAPMSIDIVDANGAVLESMPFPG